VKFLTRLHEVLEKDLNRKGLQRLWDGFSMQRCPPNPQEPQRVLVVLFGKQGGILCMKDKESGMLSLPEGDVALCETKGQPLKQAAAKVWREAFGISGKMRSGVHIALDTRLKKPVVFGRLCVVSGRISSCVEACDEIAERLAEGATFTPAVYSYGQNEEQEQSFAQGQRVAFEYVENEQRRTALRGLTDVANSAEGYVATGPAVTKIRAAVMLHDGESVLRC